MGKTDTVATIAELTDDELAEMVYFTTLSTSRKLYDWTGYTPLLNENYNVIGVIPDGKLHLVDYTLMEFKDDIKAFILKTEHFTRSELRARERGLI